MNAFEWASSLNPIDPPPDFHCPASDVWQGRFSRIAPTLLRKNFDPDAISLLASAIGEIGDNCFAHNAPGWIDTRGCWFEYKLEDHLFHCIIADRGRGILKSLQGVRPELHSHQEALLTALTERVTGRAPEQRGNGLKYVMTVLSRLRSGTFLLHTGDASFSCDLPLDQTRIKEYITTSHELIRGTYCEIKVQL